MNENDFRRCVEINKNNVVLPEGTLKIIYVLPQNIAANFKDKGNRPVIRVNHEGQEILCHAVSIEGPSMLLYDNERPQPGDGRVWLQTIHEVTCFRPSS